MYGPHSTKPTTLILSAKELKTMGSIASVLGATVTVTGVICNFIPSPQTQAAGKALIPAGSTLSNIGTGLTLSGLTLEKDGKGFARELIVSGTFYGLGKTVDAIKAAKKISGDDFYAMKGLLAAEEPLVGNEVSKYFPDAKTKSIQSKLSNSKKSVKSNPHKKTNSSKPNSMPEFVIQFQK